MTGDISGYTTYRRPGANDASRYQFFRSRKETGERQKLEKPGAKPGGALGRVPGQRTLPGTRGTLFPDYSMQLSSRKLPCKHGLGLLLLAVNTPSTVPTSEPPEWITTWLAKRAATSKRREAKTEAKEPASSEDVGSLNSKQTAVQKKTAEKRLSQVTMGIDRLDLWLNDIVRNGLGKLETQPAKFWAGQKALMEDAQAKGLANRVARMADIPNSSPDWPEKLLAHLGQLALLTQAFRRLDQLDPALQDTLPYLLTLLGIQENPDPLAQMDPQIKRQRTLDAIKRSAPGCSAPLAGDRRCSYNSLSQALPLPNSIPSVSSKPPTSFSGPALLPIARSWQHAGEM